MIKNSKKFFKTKKEIFWILLEVISFSLYYHLALAQGEFTEVAPIGGGSILVNIFVTAILLIPYLIGRGLFLIMALLLSWVTSPSFISLSYTNAGLGPGAENYNAIVGLGWSMMRDFANIIIVLALVVIGLATVLRIEEYQAKKTLPRLVLVALLVNFSPVITGLVIDASNIVMFSLLKDLTSWQALVDATLRIGPEFSLANLTQYSFIGEFLGRTLYFWLGAIIFFIYTFLYMARYVALWVLVIFSPLAFACYILRGTQQYFSLWWKQFLSWSLIGVIAAFFLSLTNQLFFLIDEQRNRIIGGTTGLTFFNELFPYFIPIVFLFLGLFIGFATAAYGANTIINWARSRAIGTPLWLGTKAGQRIGRWAEEKAEIRKRTGTVVRGWEKVPVARWFLPEKLRIYAEFEPAIRKEQEALKSYSSETLAHRIVTGDLYGIQAVAALLELANRGDVGVLFNAYREKYEKKLGRPVTADDLFDLDKKEFEEFREKMGRFLELADRGGIFGDFVRRDPRLARIAAGRTGGIDIRRLPRNKLGQDEAVRKITEEAREPHVASWDPDVLKDKTVLETMMARKGRAFWETIARVVKRGRETALNTMEEMFSEWIDENVPVEEKEELLRTPEGRSTLWEKYRAWFKENYKEDAYFAYAETFRAREQKWTMPRYIPPDIRELIKKPETVLTPAEKARILTLPEREPAPLARPQS